MVTRATQGWHGTKNPGSKVMFTRKKLKKPERFPPPATDVKRLISEVN